MSAPLPTNPVAATRSETALSRILQVWRPQYTRLITGIVIAELAVCAGLALMGQAGGRMAGAAIGVGAAYLLLRLSGAAQIILRYFERLYTHDAMFRALADLRVWFYRRLAGGAAAGLGFQRSGDLLSRLVSDVQTLDSLYLRILVPLISALLTLPIATIVWMKAGTQAGLLTGALFAILAFVLPLLGARLSRRFGPDILHAESELRVAALDLASGLREARAFGAEDVLAAVVTERQETLFKTQRRQQTRMALMQGFAGLIAKGGIAIILCAVAGILFPQAPAVAGLTALFVAITALEGVTGLARAGLLSGQVNHAAQRIVEIADKAPPAPEGNAPLPLGRDLRLENVTFSWTPDRAPIFRNLNLTLRQGERAALIGPSGAGKSSLAALLLKAASPKEGQILLGGTDISTLRDRDLRSQIAWLSQASHLFDDTVRGNLLLGREDIPDEALWTALEQARIADVVRSLPDGLATWIGEGGSKLSGGQGRRIALARVLLSDAPILVLDEPATGLDADTERAFLETLNNATEGRSILLIAHRLTGVEKLDRIWRLEDGQVISSAC
ncbi:thiol reductant ABC exporter subunit CydC [Gluconobacter albidus]|uniref:ABC transporter ATP-binding protein n=1 Tax=Gluconobacter albidus TaxID=318683 RepID=A0AAW3QYC2_9PROT|nr:thiol reductant ABC exporter subunit CydC [Gluconobacter albidus]KXV39737.1 ABC transporter ATP-binding protein [Gluconobacter albidus]MBS1027659.1 thiol reductant ABC exporter subunit CydC [Gluconobacter albidus]GBQ87209.1 transport ATP-binding protein CydD [Gluconobacter albidus NBRC 3250]GLQ69322.1 cysteine/glutathione ABC transporter ATP-binding protein/permease CydC [Gluconobacter albidus]